jgi:hypothetical protein
LTQAAEQRVGADYKSEFSCQTSTGFASHSKAYQFQCCIQTYSLAGVMSDDGRQSFAEDAGYAEDVLTAEAAGEQF